MHFSVKINEKGSRRESQYRFRLYRACIITLLGLISLFQLVPKRRLTPTLSFQPIELDIVVQSIPATEQMIRRGTVRPVKPKIPVASEDPELPTDAVIDPSDYFPGGDSPRGRSGLTSHSDTLAPVPVMQVIPKYSESSVSGIVRLLLKVDNSGRVSDVVVSKNTTSNDSCAALAVRAAYKNIYQPARVGNRTVTMWTICEYGFNQ
ncbi:hypothetical protein GF407_06055 [candidate division KSB1 bacterium]|nr:hypothetical protein [candidate division KSB1 bacterium]